MRNLQVQIRILIARWRIPNPMRFLKRVARGNIPYCKRVVLFLAHAASCPGLPLLSPLSNGNMELARFVWSTTGIRMMTRYWILETCNLQLALS